MKLLRTIVKGPRKFFLIALLIVLGVQIFISSFIDYPPNEEQLGLILTFPLTNHFLGFWIVKILSLFLLAGSLIVFRSITSKIVGEKVSTVAALLVASSPTTYAIWNLHPIDSVKAFVVMVACLLLLKLKSVKTTILGGMIIILVLGVLARNSPLSNIPILTALRTTEAENELRGRLNSEMALVNQVPIPLSIKRVAYNKPYFQYKNVTNLIISFGNVESLFFQEVNSLGQKSFVIFFWPDFIFFVLGLFWFVRWDKSRPNRLLVLLTLVAFVDFILLNKPLYQQFFLTLFPLSILVSFGMVRLASIKPLSAVVALSFGFSFLVGYMDIVKRPAYWLDNRPLVYRFIFQEIRKYQNQNFHFDITTMIGQPEQYCKYYLGSCPPADYAFDSFSLKDRTPVVGTIYAGFIGEFIGPDLLNTVPTGWPNKFPKKGLAVLSTYTTRDTIAYHFGDTAVVAMTKQIHEQ